MDDEFSEDSFLILCFKNPKELITNKHANIALPSYIPSSDSLVYLSIY